MRGSAGSCPTLFPCTLGFAINAKDRLCIELQGGYIPTDRGIVTLQCNTYSGRADHGSIVAIAVDDINW